MEKLDFDVSEIGRQAAQAFHDYGVVCVRRLLDPNWISMLRDAVDDAIAHPGPGRRSKPGERFIVENCLWRNHDAFYAFALESPVAELAGKLMFSERVRMFNDTMFVKEPSTPEPTPWHHDLPYFKLGGKQNCSVWIGLDPVNQESGAMSFALGSHRWGKMYRPVTFGQDSGKIATEDEFEEQMPDIDADPERYPTISFDLQPGDVTFHNLLTIHKAGVNATTGRRRRAHTIRMAGDDAVYLDRAYATAEFDVDLADGDPLSGPAFPILWQR